MITISTMDYEILHISRGLASKSYRIGIYTLKPYYKHIIKNVYLPRFVRWYMIESNSECYLFLFQGSEIGNTQLVGLKILYQPSQIIRDPTCTINIDVIYIYILYIYKTCISNCKFVQISLYYELLMTFLISLFYEWFILFWFLCSLCPRMITSPPLPSLGGEPRPHFLPQNQKRSVYITCINIIATT